MVSGAYLSVDQNNSKDISNLNTGAIAERILALSPARSRLMVAIAGPPGAGKSTLANDLATVLNTKGMPAKVVPMDGFHLDNDHLEKAGLLARKGAPETFDADGFVQLTSEIANNHGRISIPGFDRRQDTVIPDQDEVGPEHSIILVEGNYLLLDFPPWNQLQGLFDLRIMINPGFAELEKRLVERWLDHGLSGNDAEIRAHSNDIPNAKTVLNSSIQPDLLISDQQ